MGFDFANLSGGKIRVMRRGWRQSTAAAAAAAALSIHITLSRPSSAFSRFDFLRAHPLKLAGYSIHT